MGFPKTTIIEPEKYGELLISVHRIEQEVAPSYTYFENMPTGGEYVLEMERTNIGKELGPLAIVVGNIHRFCSDLDGSADELFEVGCSFCLEEKEEEPLLQHEDSFVVRFHEECHQYVVAEVKLFVEDHKDELVPLQL